MYFNGDWADLYANPKKYLKDVRNIDDRPGSKTLWFKGDIYFYIYPTLDSDADHYIYMYGAYRRDLTENEIRKWLQGGGWNHPAFKDWLVDLTRKFDSFDELQSYVNKTFKVRNRLVQVEDKVVRKSDCYLIDLLNEDTWELEPTYTFNTSIYFKSQVNPKIFFKILHYRAFNSRGIDHGVNLYDLIAGYTVCEHDNAVHKEGEPCPVCARKFRIQSYSTDALSQLKFKNKGEKRPIYMGIELEFDTAKDRALELLRKYHHHMIAKEDASILGFELVTAPATFAVHKEEFEEFPFEEQIVSHRDGMHVHVGRDCLNVTQIGKICEFMYNADNLNFLQLVAGRELNNYCSQASNKKGLIGNLNTTDKGLEFYQEGSHGTALNISNKNTIEFRIFASPKTKEAFMSRLEFVRAIVEWTSPGAVAIPIREFNKLEHFTAFVDENQKMFPNLHKTISKE